MTQTKNLSAEIQAKNQTRSLHLKTSLFFIACAFLMGVVLTALVVVAVNPSTPTTISGGVFPSFTITIWKEGTNYFAKTDSGTIPSGFSGSNVSAVFHNAQNSLPHPLSPSLHAGTVYFKAGKYSFDTPLLLDATVSLKGDGKENTIFEFTASSGDGILCAETYYGLSVEDLMITNTRATSTGNALYLYKTHYGRFLNLELRGKWERGVYCYNAIGNYFYGVEVQGRGITDANVISGVVLYDTSHSNTFLDVIVRGTNRSVYMGSAVDHNRFIGGEYGYAGYPTIREDSEAFYLTDNTKWNIIDGVWIEHVETAIKIASATAQNNTFLLINFADVTTILDNSGSGTGNVFRFNEGFVTQQTGSAVISSSTTVVFNHGLATTPTLVLASFNDTAVNGWKWTATATQVTITVTPSGTYSVYWYAEYKP